MREKTFLILGGYGNTGQVIARLLLQQSNSRIVLAGRSPEKAEKEAAQLNIFWGGGNRARGISVDASDSATLERMLEREEIDFIIVASSTSQFARPVAIAALHAGIDYLDINYSTSKMMVLKGLAGQIEAAGRCFITEAGYHPGLPAALVRYASLHFDQLEKAVISSAVSLGDALPQSMDTLYEFIEEFKNYESSSIFKDGRWQTLKGSGYKDILKVDFGGKFGKYYAAPMLLEEMKALPEMIPALKETGFYIAETNNVVNWVIFPLIIAGLQLSQGRAIQPLAKLFYWSYKIFPTKTHGVIMRLEAQGEKNGQPHEMQISLYHDSGYMFTAIPVVAALLQYLDGSANQPGLWLMGHLIEPERFMRDMERLGAQIQIKESIEYTPSHSGMVQQL